VALQLATAQKSADSASSPSLRKIKQSFTQEEQELAKVLVGAVSHCKDIRGQGVYAWTE
jgi:hypothetical protein